MDIGKNKYETPQQPVIGVPGSATVQSTSEGGAEGYGHAEQAVSDVYDKTTPSVSKAYKQAMSYCSKNPGKTILVSLGIGVGMVVIMSASFHRTHTGRFTRTVVRAFSALIGSFTVKALWYLKKQYKQLGKVHSLKGMEDRYA
jgi:hypothetical protein